ncbi:L,D-transpeptidase [Streptacidiphilus monticola]|uniref:Ig-like domain-containing protein n=1 Tax=Streptacidiphilus monticola TaxID=2161674 RepID=A0ABW1FXF8_9ACTN
MNTRLRSWAPWLGGALVLVLSGCSGGSDQPQEHAVDAASLVKLSTAAGQTVDPSTPLTVTAVKGTLTDVTIRGADGRQVAGKLAPDGRSWHSTGTLAAGAAYQAQISADDGSGGRGTVTEQFHTKAAAHLLTATFTPQQGGSYGVGEPITVTLSQPVKDPAARAVVERGLVVRSSPSVTGAWYWVDDTTLHFRPQGYWPAHATVQAAFQLQGVKVQGDTYGGALSATAFTTRDKWYALTDARSDYMTVYRNDKVVRRIPVTTGKPGFSTRNGIKVVLEQQSTVFMDSRTVGIAAGSSNSYALNVRWASRVTWSGEYVHAAPWSVGSQGVANVSHGCTGMSTENARWFYDTFRPGDLVEVVHSLGHEMERFGNGYGDWNVSWADWEKGSALHRTVTTGAPVNGVGGTADTTATAVGYLRPSV